MEGPQQMQMATHGVESHALLDPPCEMQHDLGVDVAAGQEAPTRRPPLWAGLLLAGLSVAVLLACEAAAVAEPTAATGQHLRSGKTLRSGGAVGPPPGAQDEKRREGSAAHRGGAPLRMLSAAAGGGAVAGAWMAVGAFIGKCFGAIAGAAGNLCHACGSLSANICGAVGKCGSDCCTGLGGPLQSCPWCGGCLSNFWFGIGDLIGGCFHAVVAFFAKMYGLAEGCLNGCCGAVGKLGGDCCGSVGNCLARICPC